MKLLVDACAWSLLLRRRRGTKLSSGEQVVLTTLTQAIHDGLVLIIGPIRQEVLSGIREAVQFEKLRAALETFQDVPIITDHYEEAARLFNLCRRRGVECGSTDILICAVAIQAHSSILTYDEGLKRCIQILRAEGLNL